MGEKGRWREEESPIPRFCSKLNVWLMGWNRVEEVNYPLKEGSTRPDDLAGMVKRPMRDSSYLRRHPFLSPYCLKRVCRHSGLSFGRPKSPAMVSITIPKTGRHVDGPSCLWAAMGMHNISHSWSGMVSDSAHCGECGGPMNKIIQVMAN